MLGSLSRMIRHLATKNEGCCFGLNVVHPCGWGREGEVANGLRAVKARLSTIRQDFLFNKKRENVFLPSLVHANVRERTNLHRLEAATAHVAAD
jgi:hypothetical protein